MIAFYMTKEGFPLGEKNSSGRQWMKAGDFDVNIHFNQHGFRDTKDLQNSTHHDTFVVGDSFSFGHGVEERERYSNILEGLLASPVYNISIPTNFDGYEKLVAYAQKQGATIRTLLVGICMENDLQNYASSSSQQASLLIREDHSSYHNKVTKNVFFKLKVYLGNRLALYKLFISLFHQNEYLHKVAVAVGIMDSYSNGISRAYYSEAVLERSVQRVKRLQEARNIPQLIPIIIPSRALWVGENRANEIKVHDRFVSLLQQAGYSVIDLRSGFEATNNPLQFHFQHDGHWNATGHRKAAELIFEHYPDSGAFNSPLTEKSYFR